MIMCDKIKTCLEWFNDIELECIIRLGLEYYPITSMDENLHNPVTEALLALSQMSNEKLNKAYSYNVNNAELFTLWILYGFNYSIIQQPFFTSDKPNKFIKYLHTYLDNLIRKAPQYGGSVLYRHEKYYSVEYFQDLYKNSKLYITRHYFTVDYDDYERTDGISFIIFPLRNGKTKAHELYKIMPYNDSVPFPEHQINFERDSSFIVKSVNEENNRKFVVLEEIE